MATKPGANLDDSFPSAVDVVPAFAKPVRPPHIWLRSLALFLVALLVRLAPLNRYVTPDEPIWVLRSLRFADAVTARDGAAIPQTGHPGITTMALGALGIRLTQTVRPEATAEHLTWLRNVAWLAPENDIAFDHLAFFLPAGRALVALATATGIAAGYAIARARLGERTARWFALFLALDPFSGGLSGLLHTDALQATFVLLAVLEALPKRATTAPSWLNLIATAVFLALAGLTKTLGLLIAPGVALAVLLLSREPLRTRVLRVGGLTISTTALYLILYPPFWADPRAALESLIAAATYHEGIGLRDVFFAGQMTVDPGPLFYPVVVLFRLTTPVFAGLIVALLKRSRRNRAMWFLIPALLYLLAITTATKKFDRYALSAIVLLTGIAAITWARYLPRRKWGVLAALLLPWSLVVPLPLYHANPLLGGPWTARHVVPLGWGEGYGLAAAQATDVLVDAGRDVLLTANVPGAAPYFPGATQPWDEARAACAAAFIAESASPPPGYVAADVLHLAGFPLATLYTHTLSLPAGLPLLLPGPLPGAGADYTAPATDAPALRAWLAERFPVGAPFRWVHAPDCYPVSEAQLEELLREFVTCEPSESAGGLAAERCVLRALPPASPAFGARFAGTLDLIAGAWTETARAPDALPVRLRWRVHAPQETRDVYLALRGADGDVVWAEGGSALLDDRAWPTSAWETGALIDSMAYIPLPLSLPPGTYTLTLSLANEAGGWIGLVLPGGTFGGTQIALGSVDVVPPPYPAPELPELQPSGGDFPGLRLLGASALPETLWAGARLPFRLGWERVPGNPPATLHWMLACAGEIADEGDVPLALRHPGTWPAGHRYVTRYAPRTDPLLPEGPYTLDVQIAGTPVTLGELTVQQRDRRYALPQPPQTPLDVTVGNFARLAGADWPQTDRKPGETFDVTLYAQATGTADRDYTVFVHLIGADGRLWAQSDVWPERGAAPTTSWVVRQVIVDVHTLTLPPDVPAGAYTLFVGLYDAERGGRVPLFAGDGARYSDDRAPIGIVGVVP